MDKIGTPQRITTYVHPATSDVNPTLERSNAEREVLRQDLEDQAKLLTLLEKQGSLDDHGKLLQNKIVHALSILDSIDGLNL